MYTYIYSLVFMYTNIFVPKIIYALAMNVVSHVPTTDTNTYNGSKRRTQYMNSTHVVY